LTGAGVHGRQQRGGFGEIQQPFGKDMVVIGAGGRPASSGIDGAGAARLCEPAAETLAAADRPVAVERVTDVREAGEPACEKILSARLPDLSGVVPRAGQPREPGARPQCLVQRVYQDGRAADPFQRFLKFQHHLADDDAVVAPKVVKGLGPLLAGTAVNEVDVPRAVETCVIENALHLVAPRLHARLLNDHDPRDVIKYLQHGISVSEAAKPVNVLRKRFGVFFANGYGMLSG